MEASDYEYDSGDELIEDGILELKEDPQAWFSQNPSLAKYVITLILELADDVEKLSDSFGYLFNIRSLQIYSGKKLKYLPHSLTCLPHLEELRVKNCPVLEELPSSLGHLSSLESLRLVCCGIKYIPLGLCNLTSLSIDTCPIDFQVCKEFLSGLTKLESLYIRNCENLQELSTDLNTLVSLRVLSIRRCSNFKFLPSFGALLQLLYLYLDGCLCLSELPGDFDELTNLFKLDLEDTNIQSLPSTLTKLPKLEFLTLPACFKLETLPNDLNFDLIRISIPDHYKFDTLPTKFSFTTYDGIHWLHSKATFSDEANSEPDPEELRQGIISEQTIVKIPPNWTDLLLDSKASGLNVLDPSLCRSILQSGDRPAPPIVDDNNIVGQDIAHALQNGQADLRIPEYEHEIPQHELNIMEAVCSDNTINVVDNGDGLNVTGDTAIYHSLLTPRDGTSEHQNRRHRSLELTKGADSRANDLGIENNEAILLDAYDQDETTNQHTCAVRGETSEIEGEGHQTLGLTEGSNSSANDARTERCLAISQDDINNPSRKCKRAQNEQTKSPMDQNDDGVISEATNQQTSCFEGVETLSEGEGYQPLGLTEGSKSSANDVGTKKCKAKWRNNNYSSSSRNCKINEKTITSEQNQSPMDKKDQHGKRRKINNEEVLRLRGSGITRREAAFQLKIPEGTFNQYLRFKDIKWPYNRAKKQLHTAKRSSSISCIKAEYAGDIVKVESSSTTSIDELRDIVQKKLNLEERRFKLKYLDETNEMIMMADNSDVVDAFKASTVRNEVFVRIWVMDV